MHEHGVVAVPTRYSVESAGCASVIWPVDTVQPRVGTRFVRQAVGFGLRPRIMTLTVSIKFKPINHGTPSSDTHIG